MKLEIRARAKNGGKRMWMILLEALGALAVLGFVVWWTMFSGRQAGELPPEDQEDERPSVQ